MPITTPPAITPPTGNEWIDNARDMLRQAQQKRLAAEAECEYAEQDLLAAWMSSFGSDGYKRQRYAEDSRLILNAVQLQREADERQRESDEAARDEFIRVARKEQGI